MPKTISIRNRHDEKYTFTIDPNTNLVTWTGPFNRTLARKIHGRWTEKIVSIDPSGGPRIAVDAHLGHIHECFKGLTATYISKIAPLIYQFKVAPRKKNNESSVHFAIRESRFNKFKERDEVF